MKKEIVDYLRRNGRKGGQVKSSRKKIAAGKNLKIARAVLAQIREKNK